MSASDQGSAATPPGYRFHGCLLFAAWIIVWHDAAPWDMHGSGWFFIVAIVVGIVVIAPVIWVVDLIRWVRGPERRSGRRWSMAPALVGIVAMALSANLPSRALLELEQRTGFEAVVDEWEQWVDDDMAGEPRASVNGYEVVGSEAGVLFSGDGHGGFAYLPDGPVADVEWPTYTQPCFEHLSGAWFRWRAGRSDNNPLRC